jgi:hypothetical protein
VVDMALEFGIDTEGNVLLTNWMKLGIIRPELCLMLAINFEMDMHLYTSP